MRKRFLMGGKFFAVWLGFFLLALSVPTFADDVTNVDSLSAELDDSISANARSAAATKSDVSFPDAIVSAEDFFARGEWLSAQIEYQNALAEILRDLSASQTIVSASASASTADGDTADVIDESIAKDDDDDGEKSVDEKSALVEFIVAKLSAFTKVTGDRDDFAKLLRTAETAKNLSPISKRFAKWAAIEIALQDGDFASAKQFADELQLQRDFLILGPFANERGRAFNPDLIGENRNLDFSAEYVGKKNSLTWRPIHLQDPSAYLDFAARMHPAAETLAYASVFVESDREQTLALRMGSDDALAIWVNGSEIFRDDSEHRAQFGQHQIPFTLHKGLNLLLGKIGQAQENWGLLLSWSALDGTAADGVKNVTSDIWNNPKRLAEIKLTNENSATATATADDTNEKNALCDQGGIATWKKICDELPRSARARYFYASLVWMREIMGTDAQPLRQLLMQAIQLSPRTSIYPLALADISDETSRPRVDRDENMRRLALNKALEISGNNVAALTALADYYLYSMGTPERAEEYLTLALAQNRLSPFANVTLAEIYLRRNSETRALPLLADLAKRFPRFPAVQMKYAETLLRNGQAAAALAVYQNLIKNNRLNEAAIAAAVKIAGGFGEWEKAATLWQDFLTLRPESISAKLALAEILLRLPDVAAAEKFIADLQEFAPQSADGYALQGRLELLRGHRDVAETALATALKLDPAKREIRDYLQYRGRDLPELLAEIPDLAEYAAAAETELAQVAPTLADDYAIYLHEQIDELHANGTKRRGTRIVAKILTAAGAEKMRRAPIWYDEDTEEVNFIAARALNPDGGISEAQLVPATKNSEQLTHSDERQMAMAIFPALKIGDVVEVAYIIEQNRPDFFGDYFGYIHRFRHPEWTLRSRYTLRAPVDKKIYFYQHDNLPANAPRVVDGQNEWQWEQKNLDGLPQESFSPPANELSPTLEISTFKDWNSLARWYWGLIKSQHVATPEILEKVAEIKKRHAEPRAQIAAVYDWVSNEVRNNAWAFGVHGFRPYSAGAVFTRRFGDCKDKATLINVMARALGFNAYPVLIHASDDNNGRGREDLTLPVLAHFNHCISAVEFNRERFYLDGTMNFRTLESLPYTLVGAKAVIIRDDGAVETSLPPYAANQNEWNEQSVIMLEESGSADLAVDISGNGETAFFIRAWFRDEGAWDEILKVIGGEKYGHVSAAVVNEVAKLTDEQNQMIDEVAFDARLRIRDYAKIPATGTAISCPLPSALLSGKFAYDGALPRSLTAAFAPTSQRETDLLLPALMTIKRDIKIDYPENWQVASALAPILYQEKFGELKVNFLADADVVEVIYELKLTSQRISAADYPAFRKFCLSADQAAKLNLRFTK